MFNIIILMGLAENAFLFVVILGVVGTLNSGEPISELTFYLIAFLVPTVMVFSFYTSGVNTLIKKKPDKPKPEE